MDGTPNDDLLTGDSGDNTLNGLAGDDTLRGLEGADTLNGGEGVDTADYGLSDTGVDVNLDRNTAKFGHAAGDVLTSIENLIGSAFNDTLDGDDNANVIDGGDGNDFVEGAGGDDTLMGGMGDDTIGYIFAPGAVNVNLATGTASGAHGNDVFSSFENIIASGNDDTLTGSDVAGGNNIGAGFGDDLVTGGANGDFLRGQGGSDTLLGMGGNDRILGADSSTEPTGMLDDSIEGGAGDDTLFASFGDDYADGGADDDEVDGDDGDDTLIGGSGADTITGGNGDDSIDGGIDDDEIEGGTGDDYIDGGAGDDDATYQGALGDFTIVSNGGGVFTVTDNNASDGLDEGTDTLVNVETAVFGVFFIDLNSRVEAADDAFSIDAAGGFTGDLYADNGAGVDSDFDGDAFSVTEVDGSAANIGGMITLASGALLTVGAGGAVTYSANGAFDFLSFGETATDSFTYTIDDGIGGADTATVTITINGLNADPVAGDDAASVDEDAGPVTINVLENDSDAEDGVPSVTGVDDPANGTAIVNLDGTIDYTPDANFNGFDVFNYTVTDSGGATDQGQITVTVNPVNDDPIAGDDAASLDEDNGPVTINVLGNDSDIEDSVPAVTSVDDPANGTAIINGDGTINYTPDANFNGVDVFNYTVTDSGGATDQGQITVTVNPVNDDPIAGDDVASVAEDNGPISIAVLDNDSDIEDGVPTVASVEDPSNGTTSINPDGTIRYTPDADFNGVDVFTYTVTDTNGATDSGQITVTVTSDNDGPVARDDVATLDEDNGPISIDVLDNDSDVEDGVPAVTAVDDPSNGTASINPDGSISYTPDADFNGVDVFSYTVADSGGAMDQGQITVTVNAVNDDPVAGDDMFTVAENGTLTGSVLADNGDGADGDFADGESVSVTRVNGAAGDVGAGIILASGASLTVNADGAFSYDPDTAFLNLPEGAEAVDSFSYEISDGAGGFDTATVTITVMGLDPVATEGADILIGSDLNDTIEGLGGDDFAKGAGGSDVIDGGAGNDSLEGGAGDDTLKGLGGDDTLIGDAGADNLQGGDGVDVAKGAGGDDFISGGEENDALNGEDGADTLKGGGGDDFLIGGAGADRLEGEQGNDILIGGEGDDVFVFSRGDDFDRILDFEGGETVTFEGFGAEFDELDEILGAASETPDGLLFDFGMGDQLLLANTSLSEFLS